MKKTQTGSVVVVNNNTMKEGGDRCDDHSSSSSSGDDVGVVAGDEMPGGGMKIENNTADHHREEQPSLPDDEATYTSSSSTVARVTRSAAATAAPTAAAATTPPTAAATTAPTAAATAPTAAATAPTAAATAPTAAATAPTAAATIAPTAGSPPAHGGEADADAEEEEDKPSTGEAWVEGKDDAGERGPATKNEEASHTDTRGGGGGGSNRAQRTCRRLALKRIRQYVGYFEEDASTPTASDGRPHDEERALFKEARRTPGTPSTGSSSGLRSQSSSSRTRRSGSTGAAVIIQQTPSSSSNNNSSSSVGTRQRGGGGGRIITLPEEHLLSLEKHADHRSRAEKEHGDAVEATSGCSSPVVGANTHQAAPAAALPATVAAADAVPAAAAALPCVEEQVRSKKEVVATAIITSEELGSTDKGCISSSLNGGESVSGGVMTPIKAAESSSCISKCTEQPTAPESHQVDCNSSSNLHRSSRSRSSSGSSNSSSNSSGSDGRQGLWTEDNKDDAAATAGGRRTADGTAALRCDGKASTRDVGAACSSLLQEDDGAADDEAAEEATAGIPPEISALAAAAAGTTQSSSSAGSADSMSGGRHSSTLLRVDHDVHEHQRWQQQQQQQRLAQQQLGQAVVCLSSNDLAGGSAGDRILSAAEKVIACEKDLLLFSNAAAAPTTVTTSAAAAATTAAAAAPSSAATSSSALPTNMLLPASTLSTLRPSACAASGAAAAASIPASLSSPSSTCAAQQQQHAAVANLNALMVKSVSPAGVVRRGGRNRRKRTKYDLAYRQMEQLGPFAEEAKAVDLSKVSGSSFAVELLRNPELYSYEAWSHGFAWPVGADGRRLLLRKLRGVYWSDPEYWQQRLMNEGLYRRDLFTLATVQELFKVTHLMGPAVWDFLLKCTALTHKCDALTAKDSDQTDGEDGGGAAAHGSSPEALSPNAGPRPLTTTATEMSSICSRRLGSSSSSRGVLLPASAGDLQVSVGSGERLFNRKAFRTETTGADSAAAAGGAAVTDTAAAAAARALAAAAAGAAADDPVSFSSWLRATTAGVTSFDVVSSESLAGLESAAAAAAADAAASIVPEGVLLLSHPGGGVTGSAGATGTDDIDQAAAKSGSSRRNFTDSSSHMKKPFFRCGGVAQTTPCEAESSGGLELDLSTQQVLDAVAAAVEAAAAGQSSQERLSQEHLSQATTLANRNNSSVLAAERGAYLTANSDIAAAVLAAAGGFQAAYDCSSSSSASPTPHVAASSEGADAFLTGDNTQSAASRVAVSLPPCVVTTDTGSSNSGSVGTTSFERAAAAAFGEAVENSAAAAGGTTTQQRLSAAAAAAAAADWLGSLQQLLPPVLHDSGRCDAAAHVEENKEENSVRGGVKGSEATAATKRNELVCNAQQYTSLSVFGTAGDVTDASTAGARMADKLLELLSSPSADNRSSSSNEVCSIREQPGGSSVKASSSSVQKADDAAHPHGRVSADDMEQASSLVREMSRKETAGDSRACVDVGRGFKQPCGSSAETQEEVHEKKMTENECIVTKEQRTRGGEGGEGGGRGSPGSGFVRTDITAASSSIGGGAADHSHKLSSSCKSALDLILSAGDDLPVERDASDSSSCSTCPVTIPDRTRCYNSSSSSDTGLSVATATPALAEEAGRVCTTTTLTDEKNSSTCQAALRNMMRLMTAAAAAAATTTTALDVPGGAAAAAATPSTPATVTAAVDSSGISGESLRLMTRDRCSGDGGTEEDASSVFDSSFGEGKSSDKKKSGSKKETWYSLDHLPQPQQQDQQSRSMYSLVLTLATALQQHLGPQSTDSAIISKSTECGGGGSDDTVMTEENAQRLVSLLQTLNQHLDRQQKKPVKPTFVASSSSTRPSSYPQDSSISHVNELARIRTESSSGRTHQSETSPSSEYIRSQTTTPRRRNDRVEEETHRYQGRVLSTSNSGDEFSSSSSRTFAGGGTRGRDGEVQQQHSTDLWMRCMQAMASSFSFLRNRMPSPPPLRTSESRRCIGSRDNSASSVPSDVADAEGAAFGTAAADAAAAAGAAEAGSLVSGRRLEQNDDMMGSEGSKNFKEANSSVNQSMRRRSSLRRKPTDDGAECDDVNPVADEESTALLLRALRAYASSAASVADTAPSQFGATAGPSSRRGDMHTVSTSHDNKTPFPVGSKYRLPLSSGSSSSSSSSSRWNAPLIPSREGDTTSDSSSGGAACSAAASTPSATSLLESTHALLQLKTHYDFMAQFMQCMMLLEVQQALVGLLQSLSRNNTSGTSSYSRNPSGSSSSTVRRAARRLQRRSHGRKRRISFFSSGNESSCNSSCSETVLANRNTMRSSERFTQSRRRRRRIDAVVVNHVSAESSTRVVQEGEKTLKRSAAPVLEQNPPATQTPASSSNTEEQQVSQQQKEEQPSAPAAAQTTTHSDDAEGRPPTHEDVNNTSQVVDGGDSNNKDGCSNRNNSVQGTSTCSSVAYPVSNVGRHQSHRHRTTDMKLYQRGKEHGHHSSSDVDSREDCGSCDDAQTFAEREKRISKDDRTNSRNSSRSRSISTRKCDHGEENVCANSSGSSSSTRKRTSSPRSGSGMYAEEGAERRSSRLRYSSNGKPLAEGGLQAAQDSIETFSKRDATMKSCLESLVESLRVQMKFVHVMAGHLQEHVSAAAATQEEGLGELEGNSVFVTRTNQCSRHTHPPEETETINASSASQVGERGGPSTKSADVSAVVTTPTTRPGESVSLNGATVKSYSAAGSATDDHDGDQTRQSKEASSAPELRKCGDDEADGKHGGGETTVHSTSSPNVDVQQANLEQIRSGFCEKRSRRNSDPESRSGGRNCEENLDSEETEARKGSQCVGKENSTSTGKVKSDRDDATTKCVPLPKKRRACEASASAGTSSEEAEEYAENAEPPADTHTPEQAQKVMICLGDAVEDGEAVTLTTREGEKEMKIVPEEAESTLSEGISISIEGDSGGAKLTDWRTTGTSPRERVRCTGGGGKINC